MGDLTKNLSRDEFDCSDGQAIAVDYDLVLALQDCCDAFSRILKRRVYISITSAYRSPEVNAKTPKASKKSMHLKGMAADFHLYFIARGKKVRVKSRDVYEYLDRKHPNRFGLSLYSNRVHFDVRSKKWRSPEVKA